MCRYESIMSVQAKKNLQLVNNLFQYYSKQNTNFASRQAFMMSLLTMLLQVWGKMLYLPLLTPKYGTKNVYFINCVLGYCNTNLGSTNVVDFFVHILHQFLLNVFIRVLGTIYWGNVHAECKEWSEKVKHSTRQYCPSHTLN